MVMAGAVVVVVPLANCDFWQPRQLPAGTLNSIAHQGACSTACTTLTGAIIALTVEPAGQRIPPLPASHSQARMPQVLAFSSPRRRS